MESHAISKFHRARGVVLLIVVLAVSAVLGGLYGPSARATAAGVGRHAGFREEFHARACPWSSATTPIPWTLDKAIYDGAIPGMLHVLDPHSNFFDPQQYALFREEQEGKYYGVGMIVAPRENQTVVLAPFVGFAGLQGRHSPRRHRS